MKKKMTLIERLQVPFRKIAAFIAAKIPLEKLSSHHHKLEENLAIISAGSKTVTIKDYYIEKLTIILTITFWGLGIILLVTAVKEGQQYWIEGDLLSRPDYGEGTLETELALYREDSQEQMPIQVQISPRQMTAEELQQFFQKAGEQLDKIIPAKNQSLDLVRSDLNLVSSLELSEGTVLIEWYPSPSDILDDTGQILRDTDETGELVQLKAILKYQEQEGAYECFARIYPKVYLEEESFLLAAEEELQKADEGSIYESELKLPKTIDGQAVKWATPQESVTGMLLFMMILTLICIYVGKDSRLAKEAQQCRNQLLLDYPEVVFKLTMLLGAGLTIHAAFKKVADEPQRGKKPRYVYQQMKITSYEMQSGISEAAAYENFGKRCREPVYIKLGSILSQNLKKGSKGLIELLEKEASMSLDERRAAVRKLGEEAGTKLLLPMMLMLVVVLVILLIPAMLSF